jgi:predicted nucleotidyltransferase
VLKWPDAQTVDTALRRWATVVAAHDANVLRIGYMGSYARGDWGVGSDVDLVIVLRSSDLPFAERALEFDTTDLPVPADLLVYAQPEWESLARTSPRFSSTAAQEIVWVFRRDAH